MKKCMLLLLVCVMGVAAQALIIDDFQDGNMDEYTQTVILDLSGSNPQIVWSASGGVVWATIATYDNIEQSVALRDDYSLGVNQMLRIDATGHVDGNQDIGIVVAATKAQTYNVRTDYVSVYMRDAVTVYSRGFNGLTEFPLAGGGTAGGVVVESLFIERTAADTFVTGYFSGGVRYDVTTRTVTNTAIGTAVGLYTDMRAAGTLGGLDNLEIWDPLWAAHDPTPVDGETLAGTPIGTTGKVNLTLQWKAGLEPYNLSQVNPDIKKHYVYLSKDQTVATTDPNLYYAAEVDQVSLTDPNASYTPDPTLNASGSYLWMVEEGLDNGLGGVYGPGDPNNISGLQWTFQTVSIIPVFTTQPVDQFVFAGQTAEFSVVLNDDTGATYKWYKDSSPLSDGTTGSGSVVAGSDTAILTISNAQVDDEGAYFCRATNDAGTKDSSTAMLQINRLVSYYPLETNVQDAVGSFDMILMQEGTAGLPTLVANSVDPSVGTYSLFFDNGDNASDPNGQYAQIGSGVADYQDISVTAWVYWNGGSNWQRIFDFGNDTSHYMFLTPSNGSQCRFVLNNGGGEQLVTTTPLPVGQWVHVAVTLGGDTGRLYVNGEPRGENTGMTINPVDFNPALNYIGKSQFTADAEFDGYIDDLKIYNYQVDVNTIAAEYFDATGITPCIDPAFAGNLSNLDNTGSSYCRVDLADLAVFIEQWLTSGLSTGL